MSWVRIHDGALGHPKISGLFDWRDPFHVWVWGLSHCQAHLTDGVIACDTVPKAGHKAAAALVLRGLWEASEGGGWRVHDYLGWNDSREEVTKKRSDAKNRMADARDRRRQERAQEVRENTPANVPRTSQEVPRGLVRVNKHLESTENQDAIFSRAGQLLRESYPAWYSKWRHGAKLRLVSNSLDFEEAVTLAQTWDDDRLEKLAQIVLTTDEDWISKTDRGFHIFAIKASWADDRLKQAEQAGV